MSENILTAKLISLKKELEALKIAHRRGLGQVELYSRVASIATPTGAELDLYIIKVKASIAPNSSPFPLISIASNYLPGALLSTGAENGLEYSADGYTVTGIFYFFTGTTYSERHFRVVSTSPIASVTCSIEDV